MIYGEEFLNGENFEQSISELKGKLVPNTILVFNLKEGLFEAISGREYLDDYFLLGTSQKLSKLIDGEFNQELKTAFYSFTEKLKKMNLNISKLDTNNIDSSFILIYYLELLNYRSFRKRILVNLPLLKTLYQTIDEDE